MKNVTMILSALGLVIALAMPIGAQVKILPTETVTVEGTVETIDQARRHVNVKTADGKFVAIDVPKSAKRFNELKVGDKVKVTYSNQVIVQMKKPGEPAVDRIYTAKGPGTGEGAKPGGTVSMHRIITATITEIDKSGSSITFTGPNKWKYTRRVVDPEVLDKVKVGDRVDIIWNTDASVEVS
jgi:hypothetical protein